MASTTLDVSRLFEFDLGFLLDCRWRRWCRGRTLRRLSQQIGKLQSQIARVRGISRRGLVINESFANQFLDFSVEVLHALGVSVPHGVQQTLSFDFAFLQILTGTQSRLQNLDRGHASLPFLAG